jgi:hypothetical protein
MLSRFFLFSAVFQKTFWRRLQGGSFMSRDVETGNVNVEICSGSSVSTKVEGLL